MSFADVIRAAVDNQELLKEYDRLSGTNLSMRGTPLDIIIDEATGRVEAEIPDFVDFVYNAIWLPLLAQEAKESNK